MAAPGDIREGLFVVDSPVQSVLNGSKPFLFLLLLQLGGEVSGAQADTGPAVPVDVHDEGGLLRLLLHLALLLLDIALHGGPKFVPSRVAIFRAQRVSLGVLEDFKIQTKYFLVSTSFYRSYLGG